MKCPLCVRDGSGKGGNCEKRGAAYKIVCNEEQCKSKGVRYDGETGLNGFSRGLQHQAGYRGRDKNNVLWKHSVNDHDGRDDVNFSMKVINTFGKSNLIRKVDEAVRITNNEGEKLNSKAEYHQPSLPRLVIVRNRNEGQGQ